MPGKKTNRHPVSGRQILHNPDGSISTEESITVTAESLNNGRPTNIPSIWDGKRLSEPEAVRMAVQSGQQFESFDSIDEAVTAAIARSEMLGRSYQERQTVPPNDIEWFAPIADRYGPFGRGAIDSSAVVRHHTQHTSPLDVRGFYIPGDTSDDNIKRWSDRVYPFGPDGNISSQKRTLGDVEGGLRRDTVNVVGNSGDDSTILAHEFRHRGRPDINERGHRIIDALMAQTPEDWDSALRMWADQGARETGKFMNRAETEKALVETIEAEFKRGQPLYKAINEDELPVGVTKEQFVKTAKYKRFVSKE